MQKSNLCPYLDLLLSNQDVAQPKPDPEIYVTCIRRLECTPAECLILEDNEHGLLSARRSGAHILRVRDVMDVNLENILNNILLAEMQQL